MSSDASSERIASDDSEAGRMTSSKIVLPVATTEENNTRQDDTVRKTQFDLARTSAESGKPRTRAQLRKLSSADDVRVVVKESLQKMESDEYAADAKKVPFEKKGALDPKKLKTFKKSSSDAPPKDTAIKEKAAENEQSFPGSITPTNRGTMERLASENLSLNDIKNRLNKSSRMMKLRAHIVRIQDCDQRLEQSKKQDDVEKSQIEKFEQIEVEIPMK